MRLFPSFLILLLFSILISCRQDEAISLTTEESTSPTVDPALQPFFDEFEYQASLRGITVDLASEKIIGKIEELSEQHVAGQCTYGAHIDNEITIDQTFWNDYPHYYIREMVVFHELGHCFLERGHREGAYADGSCLSIMRSGLETCRDNYFPSTRSTYLDELFYND